MATDVKGDPLPPSHMQGPIAATAYTQHGQQPVHQYPSQPYPPQGAGIDYGAGYYPPPAYQPQPVQQQNTTGVVVIGGPTVPVAQNVVVVRTLRTNVQIPDTYPGVAFCKFTPGIIETVIRSSIVVMLLVLIAVAAVTIDAEDEIVYGTSSFVVDGTGWRGAAGWVIFVAGLSLITEGIMLLLRLLNPKCFNNSYGIFGGLDITKCVLSGLGLFIGSIITGIQSAIADEDLEEYCDGRFRYNYNRNFYNSYNYYYNGNDEACDHLENIYRLVVALTAINAVCMFLITILFIWDIIYLSAGFSSKIPVPRGTEGQQHQ